MRFQTVSTNLGLARFAALPKRQWKVLDVLGAAGRGQLCSDARKRFVAVLKPAPFRTGSVLRGGVPAKSTGLCLHNELRQPTRFS